jgi:hypothetical protein
MNIKNHNCNHIEMVIKYNFFFAYVCLLAIIGIIVVAMIKGFTINDGFMTMAFLTPMTMALGNANNLVTQSKDNTNSQHPPQVEVVNAASNPVPVTDKPE